MLKCCSTELGAPSLSFMGSWSDIEEDSESEMSESDEDVSENEDEESDYESENWREITGMKI